MKHKKKLLSFCIIVAMIFTTVPVNAATQNKRTGYQILEDSQDHRIVISDTADGSYKFDYNKETNSVTFSVYQGSNDKLVSRKTVDIDDYARYNIMSSNSAALSGSSRISNNQNASTFASSSTTNQNTFSNWEYTITHGTTNTYELRRPDGSVNSYI